MNLNGIDLNLLVAFDALVAERNVTRAAARVGRTQPAMSAALARLRELLKDELFVRSPTGLQPTPRALDLAEPIGRALDEIQRTLEFTQAFDAERSGATFSVGLSDHPAYVLLPLLVEYLRKAAPNVSLRVRAFTDRDEAIALLDAGDVNVAVGVPPTTAAGRILVQPLFEERFVCILRRGHPAAKNKLDLKTFLSLPHVLVSPENDRFGLVDAALEARGLKRHLALTMPQMYAAPMLVSRSDMIATVMQGVVAASGQEGVLSILKPPIPLEPVPFVMTWHRRNDGHPAQRWLREAIAGLPWPSR
jgi:DNA-binding transcriptional LysR family regulator